MEIFGVFSYYFYCIQLNYHFGHFNCILFPYFFGNKSHHKNALHLVVKNGVTKANLSLSKWLLLNMKPYFYRIKWAFLVSAILVLLWSYFDTVLMLLRCYFGAILVLICYYFAANLLPFWRYFGDILALFLWHFVDTFWLYFNAIRSEFHVTFTGSNGRRWRSFRHNEKLRAIVAWWSTSRFHGSRFWSKR